MSEPDAVRVHGVARQFAEGSTIVTGLRCDRLAVRRGEFIAVCGPSGSGKSTLLGLLAGIDRPTLGEVVVLGQHLADMTPASISSWRAREIGLVFQDPHLLLHLTALENLVIARLPWQAPSQTASLAMELLDAVDLRDLANTRVSELSRGQQQRVGLVRAILHLPKLLLADEPTANLDRDSATTILAVLQRFRASSGATIVLATHDPSIASAADREYQLRVP